MTRNPYFNSPFLLGFDHLERLLERTAKAGDGYPPYNIEQSGDEGLCITLAVAGFAPEDLSVTTEDRQLLIRGKQTEGHDRTFLHRGIAARQFERSFVLAEGIEVTGAELRNGLLTVALARPKAEPIVRTVQIRTGNNNAANDADARRRGEGGQR
ncbi:MAG: Hsp20 family protein [Alphaproteobacteria bacterium]|nr:Hsp20 family protein [Alphaproteobacteria bacterium]